MPDVRTAVGPRSEAITCTLGGTRNASPGEHLGFLGGVPCDQERCVRDQGGTVHVTQDGAHEQKGACR